MEVCRAWHNIGLNAGRLWQHINLGDSTCATKFLVWSRQALLHITATSLIKAVPLDLACHASRLHSIDVSLLPDDMVRLFVSVGPDLPALVNLSLTTAPPTSAIFLDLSLPSLRRLSLVGVSIRWDCHNLTYLSLGEYSSTPAFFPSLLRLFNIFRLSPNLEYVRLEGFTPPSSETVGFPPITLCHLKDFIISSYPSVIRSILSTVTLGVQTRLQLYVSLFEDFCSIFPSSRVLRVSAIAPTDANNVRISRHGVYFIQNDAPAWCDDPSMFLVSFSSASLASVHACRSLNRVMELTSLTRLELGIDFLLDIPPQALKSLLRDLQHLQSLCTAFNEMADLFLLLGSIDETTRLVYLPHLVRLSFGKPHCTWRHFGDSWTDSILQMLGTRREHSPNPQVLEFCSCQGLTPAMIEALGKIADEVVVIEPYSDSFF